GAGYQNRLGRHRDGPAMSDARMNSELARALALSRELLSVAENGDVRGVAVLDAERLRLLHSLRFEFMNMVPAEREVLQTIKELNDKAIGFLEHRRRATERQMDTASLGR